MRLATLRRSRSGDRQPGVTGVARLDRRTKRLAGRLNPGDIAIIDHVDLDRVAAESLVEAKVSAVDNAGDEVFAAVKEGTRVRLSGDTLYVGTEPVAKGTAQDVDSVADLMQEA